eukprot:c9601_g1_i1 orf=3-299(-)
MSSFSSVTGTSGLPYLRNSAVLVSNGSSEQKICRLQLSYVQECPSSSRSLWNAKRSGFAMLFSSSPRTYLRVERTWSSKRGILVSVIVAGVIELQSEDP